MSSTDTQDDKKDKGWAWVVVGGSFLIQFIQTGFFLTIGILYVEMKNVFVIDSLELSWIGALQCGFLYLAAPIVTSNIDRFSPRIIAITGAVIVSVGVIASSFVKDHRILYLTLGVVPGIGFSMTHLASILILNEYFSKLLSVAIGIARGSSGLGVAVFGPLIRFLLYKYSFEGTLMILSGIILNCVIGGAIYWPLTAKTEKKEKKNCGSTLMSMCDVHLLADKEFLLFLLCNTCTGIGYWAPIAFLPELCIDKGYSFTQASTLVTIIGITYSIGQIMSALASQRFRDRRTLIYAILTLLIAVSISCLPSCTTFASLVVTSGAFGLLTGGTSCLTLILTADLFEPKRMTRSLGIVVFIQGIGSISGVPLATYLSDVLSMDMFLYYFCGGMYVLATVFFLPLVVKRLTRKNDYNIGDWYGREK